MWTCTVRLTHWRHFKQISNISLLCNSILSSYSMLFFRKLFHIIWNFIIPASLNELLRWGNFTYQGIRYLNPTDVFCFVHIIFISVKVKVFVGCWVDNDGFVWQNFLGRFIKIYFNTFFYFFSIHCNIGFAIGKQPKTFSNSTPTVLLSVT